MFETAVVDGVLRLARPDTEWLSTGVGGGRARGDAAYNVTVPEGFERTDLSAYLEERLAAAGFEPDGPALLTGVEMRHARGARDGPAVAYATAGLSNPAALPAEHAGTVNVLVGTTRSLDAGALATLLGVAVEAKAATLLGAAGVPGTTTDAVVVGCDPRGEPATFAGSATEVGASARACVRAAVRASLRSRYPDGEYPASVAAAEHGVRTERRPETFRP
ncbi:MAG: adenosylcobinamide amidohydrolase [Halobacteriales archaeon]